MIKDMVVRTRTYRRFHHEIAVPLDTLKELVDIARFSSYGVNLQALKYILCNDSAKNALIYECVDLGGRRFSEEDRPPAYILVLGDTTITSNFGCNHGIAVQNIMLGATEMGLGGCIMGNVQRARLIEAFAIPLQYEILLALALGKPKEKVVLETLKPGGNTRGWWDENGVRHVPKRLLNDIIIGTYGA